MFPPILISGRDFHFGRSGRDRYTLNALPRGPDVFVALLLAPGTVCGIHSAVELTGSGRVLGYFSDTSPCHL